LLEVVSMAALTIRDLDETIKTRLRVRAAHNGRSMEAEARVILRNALTGVNPRHGLGSRIQQRFADLDDVAIAPPSRVEQPRAADLTP
jgi:plasmid stability protein